MRLLKSKREVTPRERQKKSNIIFAPFRSSERLALRESRQVDYYQDDSVYDAISLQEAPTASFAAFLLNKGYIPKQVSKKLGLSQATTIRYAKIFRFGFQQRGDFHAQRTSRLDNLSAEVFNGAENPLVMMGTTPSGPLHLANMYTFVNGIAEVDASCKWHNKKPRFVCGFNDFTIGEKEFRQVPKRKAILQTALDKIAEEYGVKIELQAFSDLQRTDPFRRTLQAAISKGAIGFYQLREVKDGKYLPVTGDRLKDNVDYALPSLRETIGMRAACERPQIYILGGDHTHRDNNFRIGLLLGLERPHMHSTGVLFGPDGEEMHVSLENYISFKEIENHPNIIREIAELGETPQAVVGPLDYLHMIPPKYKKIYGLPRPKINAN